MTGKTTGVYCISETGGSDVCNPQQFYSISNNKLYKNEQWSAILSHDIKDLIISKNKIYHVRNGIDLSTADTVENVVKSDNVIVGTQIDTWDGKVVANTGLILLIDNKLFAPAIFN